MKATNKTVLLILGIVATVSLGQSADAATIASWDDWNDSNPAGGLDSDVSTASITTTISGAGVRDVRTDRGSNDGTFGTLSGAATATDGAVRLQKAEGSAIAINVANGSGLTLAFDKLHFDGIYTGDSLQDYAVAFVMGASSTPVTSGTLALGSPSDNYGDFDIDVSAFALDDGESGFFQVTFTGGTNPNNPLPNSGSTLDNVAITGDLVPEPSSAALLGLGSLGLILCRRR